MEQRLHLILTCQNYIVVSLTLQIRIIFALFFHITERNVNEFYSKYGNCVNLLKNVTISSVIHPIFFTFSLDFQKRSKSKFPHFIFYSTSAVMLFQKHASLDYRGKKTCLLYTSPSPRDATLSRMPSSA